MDTIVSAVVSLFTAASALTPFAIIGLLIGLIYILLWKMPTMLPTKQEVATIRDNHLHGLPQIEENTKLMVESLRRIEVQQATNFAVILSILESKR